MLDRSTGESPSPLHTLSICNTTQPPWRAHKRLTNPDKPPFLIQIHSFLKPILLLQPLHNPHVLGLRIRRRQPLVHDLLPRLALRLALSRSVISTSRRLRLAFTPCARFEADAPQDNRVAGYSICEERGWTRTKNGEHTPPDRTCQASRSPRWAGPAALACRANTAVFRRQL